MNVFNKYLTAYSGPDPVLVAAGLTGRSLAKEVYTPKHDSVVRSVLTPQLLEDVLMTVTGAEFT